MDKQAKLELINSREWFHSIEIDEVVTKGRIPLSNLRGIVEYLRFPKTLKGFTVLDIGAWDGFFSFEAERLGAKKVVAYDLHPPDQTGFSLAKELLHSSVEYIQGSVYDLSSAIGTFDIVLFIGVLYHLRYPLLALDRIWEVTNQYLLLESHFLDNRAVLRDRSEVPLAKIDPCLSDIPLFRFYRDDELNSDYSNWFSPNRRAIEDSLWSAGFKPEVLSQWGDRIAYKGIKLTGLPEYKQQTYEGLRYEKDEDGKIRKVLERRNQR